MLFFLRLDIKRFTVETAQKTENLASRVSNRQAVFLQAGASSGTVWKFEKTIHGKDGQLERIMAAGSPVVADSEVRSSFTVSP